MVRVKVGDDLIGTLQLAYRANVPPLLIGATGIGKTESAALAAHTLQIGFMALDLTTLEPVDLTGLPRFENGETHFAPPALLPKSGSGLLLLDELNRAPRTMRAACYQVLTARKINSYHLPKGWLPMAAINPDCDANGSPSSYDVDALDPAMMSRFSVLYVEPDPKQWCAWAERHGIHKAVIDFIANDPKIFASPLSNPRAWTRVSNVLDAFDHKRDSKMALMSIVTGLIGDRLASCFMKTLFAKKEFKLPSPEELIGSYDKYRKLVQSWTGTGNTAVLEAITHSVLVYLQDPGHIISAKARKNLNALLDDVPAEFRKKIKTFSASKLEVPA